ncbi:radical SAM protein [Massilia agilis]|uniref:Radical SAM protein n=1 Tax=Massilia agilis TaxID=1811226 RepID=A0ABT2D8H8_9BURK|nr:radical SAM protein [Massilia agilis]MCS0807613.1 radical SAM protein [Massilia agilis]
MVQLQSVVQARPLAFRPQPSKPAAPSRRIVEVESLQVIIKTAERCNLACQYCYYFFMGDDSFAGRQPIIGREVCERIPAFLLQGVEQLKIRDLSIAFHGGEPTLQRLRDFDRLCTALRATLGHKTRLNLGMQTNGIHLPDEWLVCLDKHGVELSFSIDGPAEYHDRYRTDRKGRGSYQRVADNIVRANDFFRHRSGWTVGSISVMNHRFDARKICHHLRDTFGIRKQSYLLPIRSWQQPFEEGESALAYGEQLVALFDAFVADQSLQIYWALEALAFFKEKRVVTQSRQLAPDEAYAVCKALVVQSNGELTVDDALISARDWRNDSQPRSIFYDELADVVNSRQSWQLLEASNRLPDACQSCSVRKLCRGGRPEHRYSAQRGFNNPSVYCEGLKRYYGHVIQFLIRNGYPEQNIVEKLGQ